MNDDAELLSKAREGDERAFAELVTRYQHIAWSVCMRITENQHDAEDALQHALAQRGKICLAFAANRNLAPGSTASPATRP